MGTFCFCRNGLLNTINHLGLTLAVAVPAEFILRNRTVSGRRNEHGKALPLAGVPARLANHFDLGIYFDFRLVMIGSIVPDILDKPLGFLIAPDLLNNNLRTIGHSGLFALAFVLAGLAIHFMLRNPQVLIMAVSSAGHLILDQMWNIRDTLLWPLLGLEFRQGTTTLSEYIWFHVHGLLDPRPMDLVTGGIILVFIIYVTVFTGIKPFLKIGKIHPVMPA